MDDEKRSVLWCRLFGKAVDVMLRPGAPKGSKKPDIPEGWFVAECLSKDTACFDKNCLFTIDEGDYPFREF